MWKTKAQLVCTFLFLALKLQAAHSHNLCGYSLIETVHQKVMETIENASTVPGLNVDEFTCLKPGLCRTWNILLQKGSLEINGSDKQIRPYFVTLQGIIEHVLSCELNRTIKCFQGMIHTPMPATPLCSKGEISRDLVDATIELDPLRLLTVKARTKSVRELIYHGGSFYIIYPRDGFTKRTETQQLVYTHELSNHPTRLFDRPLDCDFIPEELVGATYIFTDQNDEVYVFAIKMTQAKEPQLKGHFGLWFGSINQLAVKDRVHKIMRFVEANSPEIVEMRMSHAS